MSLFWSMADADGTLFLLDASQDWCLRPCLHSVKIQQAAGVSVSELADPEL